MQPCVKASDLHPVDQLAGHMHDRSFKLWPQQEASGEEEGLHAGGGGGGGGGALCGQAWHSAMF